MKLIDLTMDLNAQTPVYPGDEHVSLETRATVEKEGFQDSILRVDTHNGTHIDAPGHMIVGGAMLDAFGPERFVARGVLVDGRDGFTMTAIEQAGVRPGDIVVLWTGFSDDYQATDYYDKIPVIEPGVADYFIERRPSLVAVDAGSIDATPFEVHQALLKQNILLAENLVGLSQLANVEFEIIALPLKLDVDGSPARIIARVSE
jgi:kynurenine formamidase